MSIRLKIAAGEYLACFNELVFYRLQIVLHVNFALGFGVGGGEECGIQNAVFDVTANKLKALCQKVDVHIFGEGGGFWDSGAPKNLSGSDIGELEFHDELHAAEECGVDIVLVVGSQNRNTVVGFDLLQQQRSLVVVRGLIRAAVVRALCEKGVTFVKEEDYVALFRLTENHRDGFFGFANVLVNYLGEVNAVKLKVHLMGDNLSAH